MCLILNYVCYMKKCHFHMYCTLLYIYYCTYILFDTPFQFLTHIPFQYPELLVSCQKKVGGFLLSDERRHRNRVLNLGEFLILLSLVEVHWGAFLSVFIPEMLQRCWPTILAACPELRRMTVDEQTRVAYFHRVTSDEELLAKGSSLVENVFFMGFIGVD